MPEEKKDTQPLPLDIITSPDKLIPKFCNTISFQVTNTGLVVITLTFREPGNQPILIDRVVTDINHAKEISKVLSEVLEKAEKGVKPNVSTNKTK